MGMTPQSVNRIGGFHVQGRNPEAANTIIAEAKLLEQNGASMLLMECIPAWLGKTVSESVSIPVIGIGAGQDVDGQIMVIHDLLGISPITPKFVKNFLKESATGIPGAIAAYVEAVKQRRFPGPEHSYK
jgi:3-methyl-2-oxobutanoate hydroxymethyltransferase